MREYSTKGKASAQRTMAEVDVSSTSTDSFLSSRSTIPGGDDSDLSKDLLAELNNEGAFLIENGQDSAAIKVLRSALNVAMRDVGCSVFLIPSEHEIDEEEDNVGAACDEESSVVSRGSRHHSSSSSCHHSNSKQHQSSKEQSVGRDHNHHGISKESHDSKEQKKHSHKLRRSRHRRCTLASSTASLPVTMQRQHRPPTEDMMQLNQATNHVYAKPLRVADRYSLPSFVELALYVVYNLALANHLRVLKKQQRNTRRKGNTRHFREIVRLYKLAQSIQSRGEDIGLEPTYTISMLNNLGQAYKSLGKVNKADMCFHNLLANVVCMIDHGCVQEVDHLDDFLDNVAHILSPERPYADAA